MGLFDKILEKLDLKKKEPEKTGATTTKDSRPVVTKTPTTRVATTLPKGTIPAPKMPAPVAIPVVDVVAKLEKLALESNMKLNWKTSIVDLLTLLGIESTQGTCQGTRLPGGKNRRRLLRNEHVASQNRFEKNRRQWRQYSEGTPRLKLNSTTMISGLLSSPLVLLMNQLVFKIWGLVNRSLES